MVKVRDGGEPTGVGKGEVALGAIPLWGVKKGRAVMETHFGETLGSAPTVRCVGE